MGPYMRPIPIGAVAAIDFLSAGCFRYHAVGCLRFIRREPYDHEAGEVEDRSTRLYRWFMGKLLDTRRSLVVVSLGLVVVL